MNFIKGQEKNKIILITGAPGVGKSTIGKLLCKRLEKSILLSIDKFRRMVVGGYVDPSSPWEKFEGQFRLTNNSIASVAKIFSEKSFIPVIEGVVLKDSFSFWNKRFSKFDLHIFLLTSDRKETVVKQSRLPNNDQVDSMLKAFKSLKKYKSTNFKIIKNKNKTETVEKIIKAVYSKK